LRAQSPSSWTCRSGSPDAHLVVCRSGASTIAELGVIGGPAIMVPLPHALDNDQLRNAESFAAAGAGWVHPQASLEPRAFAQFLTSLRSQQGQLQQAAAAALGTGRPDAAQRLADLTEKTCREEDNMKLPRDVGPIHFIGIGGIGMSGIAEVMATLDYKVQGSDLADNYNVARLRKAGIDVFIGHKAENLGDAQVVVVSSAVKDDNPELVEARNRYLPIVRRAEMLAELMRFKSCVAVGGTHGKTTTTSLVAALLDAGGLDPTVINGGIINAYGTNARLGKGEWMVVESDESDGTFVKLPADIVIVTNIDPEHLDHYGTFRQGEGGFPRLRREHSLLRLRRDVHRPSGGAGADRPGEGPPRHHLWRSPQADVRLMDVNYMDGETRFSVRLTDRRTAATHDIEDLSLAIPGDHNALNSTAALAVAKELGVSDDDIRQGLQELHRRQAPLHADGRPQRHHRL
jgi:UDP-N-acetylmuramoylalanine-D-glutamate ligase